MRLFEKFSIEFVKFYVKIRPPILIICVSPITLLNMNRKFVRKSNIILYL